MPGITAEIRVALPGFVLDVELVLGGGRVAVLGANGSGKTTLLKSLLGIYRPESGRICLGEAVVFDSVHGIDLGPESRGIGYVPQGYGLFPHLSVWQNVAFAVGSQGARISRAECKRVSLEWLMRWNVQGLADRRPGTLSGGERQRVALARALAVEPSWLMLDEPFAALDARVRVALRGQLRDSLEQSGRGLLFVTHDWRDVLALATHVVVLDAGRVQYFGAVEDVCRDDGKDAPAFVRSLWEVE